MKLEWKVIIGTACFFGILLLVGWVALNEEGRMAEFTSQYEARSIERGAIIFENNCSTCHGDHGQGIPGRAPALHNPALFNGDRLTIMAWEGTLNDYIENAISAGRPNSGSYWNGNVMPTWGQQYGGPLRPDQVGDVTRYVLNWESTALDAEHVPLVLQDFLLPSDVPEGAQVEGEGETVGLAELQQITEALPVGDATNGSALYTSLGCSGCHTGGAIAPATDGTWTRVQERIAAAPELEGYTPEMYIIESILNPNAYTVADNPSYVTGDGASLMPNNFGDLVDDQGLADLLEYVRTQTG